jgi:hypothetical protein
MRFTDHPNYRVPQIAALLDQLVGRSRDLLAENFIGAWLQGSSATGHFDEHSDIDFIVGIENDLSMEELQPLQEFHLHLHNHESPWAKHLEGSYIPRDILRDYNLAGRDVWYLNHGSTTFRRSAHDNTIAVKWILREKGVVLAGPDPQAIMNPIPIAALRLDMYRTYADWAAAIFDNHEEIGSHFYQTFAVLSYCRVLHDIHCGEIRSKRDGAEWAKARIDPKWHDLIDKAWLGRPNPELSSRRPAQPEDVLRTVELIRILIDKARKLLISYGYTPESALDAA